MIISHLKYIVPFNEVTLFIPKHKEFIVDNMMKNKILLAGPSAAKDGGIIIFLSDDNIDVNEIMQEDPFVKNKCVKYNLIQFIPLEFNEEMRELISF